MKTIEEETPLIPQLIAENIVTEARAFAPAKKLTGMEEYLCERAERHFQDSKPFARKLQGGRCREHLYAFMRHWCAARLGPSIAPAAWSNGHPPKP